MSDDELAHQAARGNRAALDVLIRRHYDDVFRFVYRRVGERQTAEDLVQDVFIRVARHLTEYREDGRFPNWLITIAVNRCRDYHRYQQIRARHATTRCALSVVDASSDIWTAVERRSERVRVKRALEQLPDRQREAIVLSYFEHYRLRDIAEITSASPATVKSRIRLGLAKLRRILGEEPHSDETSTTQAP
ncbi:MAG: RNA polymerase sigma factor [Firmicutes bacterium]|nr:RNA polymerase sigma factor [Bacillota bacterium]